MTKNWLKGVVAGASMLLATAAFAETLKIGVAGPFTGPNAAFGAQLQKGAEQAVADFNAAGGIMGMQIELTSGDDVSDPKQGVSVANKFVGDGVKFVIGHFNSGVTMPASEVYRENGMLAISPSATNVCVTDRKNGPCGNWTEAAPDLMMFRTCGRDDRSEHQDPPGARCGARRAREGGADHASYREPLQGERPLGRSWSESNGAGDS